MISSPSSVRVAVPSARWRAGSRAAFSLIELLTVVALIGFLMAISLPALGALSKGGQVSEAAGGLATVFEQARSYAMAHNTTVFVGVTEVHPDATSSAATGTGKIVVAAFALKGGGTALASASDVIAISRPRQFAGVSLDDALPAAGGMARDSADWQVAGAAFPSLPVELTTGPWTFQRAVRFDPQGSAWASMVDQPGTTLELGLRPAFHTVRDVAGANVAAVQVDALTGGVRLFRP